MKILKSMLAALLAVLLIAFAVLFFYFPRYASRRQELSFEPQQQAEVKLMSCNLRCLTPLDLGKKSWFYRAELISADIAAQAPDVIGFQEATRWQYDYLCSTFPQYDSVIEYRDESVIAEGCPVFYRKDRFELVDKGSFWLSETPEQMSKDWGAACYRICSYVILSAKDSGKELVVFNTHLDHVSDEARIKGIQVVLDYIEAFGSLPSVIMGDLNAEEGSLTYEAVTENFLDGRYAAEKSCDSYTYQNWGNMEKSVRIDYFMLSKSGLRAEEYSVLTHTHEGVYASDHCPIVLTLSFE